MKPLFLFVFITIAVQSNGQILVEDTQSEFPGGMSAFYDYISNHLEYPRQAQNDKISGIVFVEFYIDEKGSVNKDSVRIVPASRMREVAGDELADQITSNKFLEKEAIRVIKTSPAWTPGKSGGKPIAEKIVFPVSFDKELFSKPKKSKKNKIRMT